MRRLSIILSLTSMLSAVSAATSNAADKPRVFVEKVRGAIGFSVEGPLKNMLKATEEVDLVSAAEAKKGVHAVVEAKTTRDGQAWVATIEVKEGATGAVKKTWRLKTKEIRKLSGVIEKKGWTELGPAIMSSSPGPYTSSDTSAAAKTGEEPKIEAKAETKPDARPEGKKPWETAESKPVPSDKPSDNASSSGGAATSGGGTEGAATPADPGKSATTVTAEVPRASRGRAHNVTPLEVSIGFDYVRRSFKYNDDLFGKLHPYTLSGAPALRLNAVWFPGAHFASGVAANVGLDLGFEYVFGVQSKNKDGTVFPTHSLELLGALKGRLPLGEHEVALLIGAGRHTFTVASDPSGMAPEVPSIGYTFLRVGAEGRFVVYPKFSARALLAWRRVLSKGDIQSDTWFPGASAVGVDLLAGVGYEMIDGLEVQIAFTMRRYAFSFNPIPGDKNIAGGALDQYFSGTLNFAYALGR